jgi:hypothetical protein
MTWIALLLADPSPCLRARVLSELLERPKHDAELQQLLEQRGADSLVSALLAMQNADGSWGDSNNPASRFDSSIFATAQALARLGYLGFDRQHPGVVRGAGYLFSQQRDDGSWPLAAYRPERNEGEGYSMIPLQTALPLRALACCGYAEELQAERAYEWLLAQRLEDGAWPTGIASGNFGGVAGYRRLAHSRWGCRSNTTGVLSSLALHPQRRHSEAARRALDLLLGRETREQGMLGFEVARLIGAEPAHGVFTYFARFDLAQVLDLCWRVGATLDDVRIAGMVSFIRQAQGPYGLWEYSPRPQATRWVTFDLLRSLSRLDQAGEWVSLEPHTPFQAYPKKDRRY